MPRDFYNPSNVNNHRNPPATLNSGRTPVALPLASILPTAKRRIGRVPFEQRKPGIGGGR